MNRKASAALIATCALGLLAAACGGTASPTDPGGSANARGSSNSRSAVAYSHCMRSRGVPDYPDPDSSGQLPKTSAQHLGVSSSVFAAAQRACQHVLPATNGSLTANSLRQCYLALACPQSLVQQAMNAGLKFSRCMRSHGVTNWPDPTIDSQGRPLFNITVPRTPPAHVTSAINECSRLEHQGSLLAWG